MPITSIPRPQAPPEPPNYQDIEVPVTFIYITLVGNVSKSIILSKDDTLIESADLTVVKYANGSELSFNMSNVLYIEQREGTIKKRVIIDPLADYKKAQAELEAAKPASDKLQ